MEKRTRKFGYGIWVLGFGYFVFYTPYSGLTKAVTRGLIPPGTSPVPGFELLPISVAATVAVIFLFITIMGWWKYAGRRKIFGFSVPFPSRETFLSGICTSVIIGTTTLAFSLSGASILFALVLLRGGVLVIAPITDVTMGRRVRWFSWTAMAMSTVAVLVVLADVSNYQLGLIAILDIAAYLAAYFCRFRIMTHLSKSADHAATMRYFVEEQIVATPVLLLSLGVLAAVGSGEILFGFRQGFTAFLSNNALFPVILIGVSYAALMVCTTFIFLDRRENTFCIPIHCGSSMMSGVAAAGVLAWIYNEPWPSSAQLVSTGFLILALAVLSPLHHPIERLCRRFVPGWRRFGILPDGLGAAGFPGGMVTTLRGVFLFVCSGNTCRSPLAEAIAKAEIARRLGMSHEALDGAPARAMSAGVTARPGAPLTAEAAAVLRDLSVPVPDHTARQLTLEMIAEADVVYCLAAAHRDVVLEMMPSAADKILCLDPDGDIDDPIGGGAEVYRKCAERVQRLIRWRFDQLGVAA